MTAKRLSDLIIEHGPYLPYEVQRGFKHLPLTDESALNELRDELIELRAMASETAELRALFDLQWTRSREADARWRAEDPEARALIQPDLGVLLEWLMARIDRLTTAAYPHRCPGCGNHFTTAVAATSCDNDHRAHAQRLKPQPPPQRRRLKACVERWPGAEIDGDYDPRCCRFPKSCSASVYDAEHVTDADLEPPR